MNNNETSVGLSPDQSQGEGGNGNDGGAISTARERWARIPQELRALPQWCHTLPSDPDPLRRKAPRKAGNALAKTTEPSDWSSFEIACHRAEAVGGQVGFVFTSSDPFAVIDLDVKNSHNEPDSAKWTAQADIDRFIKIVQVFDSYSETSQSGQGLHVLIRAKVGQGKRRAGVELYSQERFMITTGSVYEDKPIQERQELADLLAEEIESGREQMTCIQLEELPQLEADDEVLRKASSAGNAEKFNDLFNGRWQEKADYPSQSEADFALLAILTFWSQSDEQVRRLFRASALGKRAKATKSDDYLNRALSKLRGRQMAEKERARALQVQLAPSLAAIDAELKQKRAAQRFKFKMIGEGDTDLTKSTPPKMDLDSMLASLVQIISEKPMVAFRDTPAICSHEAGMRSLLAHNVQEVMQGTKRVEVPIFNLWLKEDRRIQVYTLTFDPRAAELCRSPDHSRAALNTWRPLPHSAPDNWQKLCQPFFEHVAYLVPIEDERDRFLDWLAHIEQQPGKLPHAHYLMIATAQGVGRNWLSSLMACIWRGHVALDFDLGQSLGNGFNGHLSRKLLAVVDEINEGGLGERWKHSEKLKSMVTCYERFINLKYGLQFSEVNCCRWLLFSNYESALPLQMADRRWNVIRNPTEPRDAAYYSRLYPLLDSGAFVAAVREALRQRDISHFNPGARAVMNDAKEAVVAASMSPEDERAMTWVKSYEREVILADMLYSAVFEMEPFAQAPQTSRNWKLLAVIAAKAGIEKIKEFTWDGRKVKAWALRNPQRWRSARPDELAREIWKHDA